VFHNYLITFALYSFLLLSPVCAAAQSAGRKTVQQSSLWMWMAAQLRVHKYFGVQAEAVIRLSDFQRNQQHEFHVGTDIYVNENIIISPIGYGYFLNYVYGGLPAAVQQNEHRLWQQIVYRNNIGRVGLNLRLRAEENWRERKVKDADGRYHVANYTFKPRLRARFITNIALNHRSMALPKTVFISVWDEVIIAMAPKLAYHLPEENRIHIGVGYRPTAWSLVTAGYMHHLLIRSNGLQAESNHTLLVQAVFTPDIRKRR
jgi:hypothetical protein